MIYGVGVDLVHVPRIQAGLNRFGDALAHRILTDSEYKQFRGTRHQGRAHFLAKRFAAKEAAAKALGTGFRNGLGLRHIEVRSDPLGRPYLYCHGRAAHMLEERDIGASHLSLTDEQEHALAFVTLVLK